MSLVVYTSRRGEATPVQTTHFDTTHERLKSLVRPPSASACPSASSAGSPRFYRLLPRLQSQSASFAPGGLHSPSGGGDRGNTPEPYESPDDGDNACASDTVPPSPCPPLASHCGAAYS